MKSKPNFITLFVDAIITASYYYYGEPRTQDITVNGLIEVNKNDLFKLDQKLIKDYVKINFKGHDYLLDEVKCSVNFKSINRIN